jgi:rfaE bifunctional protein kinase chain/domain
MKTFQGMSENRLGEIIARFPKARIAVLGDFFLDKYLDVDRTLAETSVETGRTAHQVVRVRHSPGAAGTVMSNLSALETGTLYAIGFTGDDGESYEMRRDLAAMRCSTEHLHVAPDRMTPQYLKPRFVDDPTLAGEHDRLDTKNRSATPAALEDRILASLDALLPSLDAVIIADQVEADDCGVVTRRVRQALAERARAFPKVVFWADSRAHITLFRNVIIKPNEFETVGRAFPKPGDKVDDDALLAALSRLRVETGAPVVVTRGARGTVVTDAETVAVPGVQVDGPTDTTGAGDSAAAGGTLALASGATLAEAALMGNLVASITIQQLATTGVARPRELPARLQMWHGQQGK